MKNKFIQKKYHLMGMGGAGVSGLAAYLLEQGHCVSGCDVASSIVTQRLEKLGGKIQLGHHPEHLKQDEILIYSKAVKKENPERIFAEKMQMEIYSRPEFLYQLTRNYKGISISGSHGKSTTAAMIAMLFIQAGLDPSVIVGADVLDLNGNARFGRGEYFIYEADESDGSFNEYSPEYFVLNNIDDDHIDYYQTFEKLKKFFQNYLESHLGTQTVFYCKDDPILNKWEDFLIKGKAVSFGLSPSSNVRGENICYAKGKTSFDVVCGKERLGTITLSLPGKHNVLNSLAAISVALNAGISFSVCQKTFALFKGVYRRFQLKGLQNEITVIDDYAHHPTEITATLETAQKLTQGRLICVFQPHRFTRTRDLGKAFPLALSKADEVVLTDIYPACETPIQGVDGEFVFKESQKAGYSHFSYEPDLKKIPDLLLRRMKKGDLLLTVGAGNVNEVGETLIKRLKENAAII